MDDLTFLLLIVGLFYLWECAYWVRPGSLVFVSFLGGRHRLHTLADRALLRNDHGGLLLGNVLPLGTSMQVQAWPVSLSTEGIVGWVAQAITPEGRPDQTERFHRYEEIGRVGVEGCTVHVNGAPFVTACSPDFAHHLAALIEKLTVLPPERREQEIDGALRAAFDAAGAAERFRSARRSSWLLMVLCTLLALFVFAFIPVSLEVNWDLGLFRYVVLYVGLLGLVIVQYVATHDDLLPQEGKSRRKHALLMLVSPAGAMHARNQLFRDVLSRYHPLAVARALCRPEVFEQFARRILLDLREPLPPVCPSADPAACAAEKWFREKLLMATLALVRGAGLDPDRLAAPPAPEGPDCVTYCPRCDGQFVSIEGTCHSCAGLPRRRFDGPPPAAFPLPPPLPVVPVPAAAPETQPAISAQPPEPVAMVSAVAPKRVRGRRGKRKR
jgi:hypothetical protein